MSIYQHFRQEEKEFIDQVLNWIDYVDKNYAGKLTDFLDPGEQYIVQSIIGKERSCRVQFFGGAKQSERCRAFLHPDYYEPAEEDFQITLFEIIYPEKFVTLTHPEILGSLMSLGLSRGKYGDILIKNKQIQFFSASEVADYIRTNYMTVGKTKIQLQVKPMSESIVTDELMTEHSVTVSSLRLDTVLSQAGRMSRQKVQTLIGQGLVKVNWTTVDSPSFPLKEGDLISARGIGRIRLITVGDKTKRDKWKITLGKMK